MKCKICGKEVDETAVSELGICGSCYHDKIALHPVVLPHDESQSPEESELLESLCRKTSSMVRQDFKCDIIWKRWNPNERTTKMNFGLSFIKFKGDDMSKISICSIEFLDKINKTTEDIEWIADIPDEFNVFLMYIKPYIF